MTNDPDLKQKVEGAIKNLNTTWDKIIFGLFPPNQRTQPIERKLDPNNNREAISPLADPEHPLTQLILWIYTIEGFIYSAMNTASRNGDESRIPTLGPYSLVLNFILNYSPHKRSSSIRKQFEEGCTLFRGTGMALSLFNEFKQLKGKIY